MSKTRHMHKRMSQRSISSAMVEIASEFGIDQGDKLILDKKNTALLLSALDKMSTQLKRIHSRGGIVVIETGGCQITTYSVDSFSRKEKKNAVH